MTDKIVVLSTCGSQEEAERLARLLVEQRLAACVNVIPGSQLLPVEGRGGSGRRMPAGGQVVARSVRGADRRA